MIEPLLLTAARVLTFFGQQPLTNASGFFFERCQRLFLVTSRHVMIDEPSKNFPDRIEIELHVDSINFCNSIRFSIPLYRMAKASGVRASTWQVELTWLSSSLIGRRCRRKRSTAFAADRRVPAWISRHAASYAGRSPSGDRIVVRPAFPRPGFFSY